MRAKLGLFTEEDMDLALIENLLTLMQQHGTDYTQTFRQLSNETLPDSPLFQTEEFTAWHTQWQARLLRQPEPPEKAYLLMRIHNPAIIPRNHQVEASLKAAVEQDDFSVMHRLLAALEHPYDDLPEYVDYSLPPKPSPIAYKTFCGT